MKEFEEKLSGLLAAGKSPEDIVAAFGASKASADAYGFIIDLVTYLSSLHGKLRTTAEERDDAAYALADCTAVLAELQEEYDRLRNQTERQPQAALP